MSSNINMWQRHDYKKEAKVEVASPFAPTVVESKAKPIKSWTSKLNAKVAKPTPGKYAGPQEWKDPDQVIMEERSKAMMAIIQSA